MNVAEFIVWLQTQEQTALVAIIPDEPDALSTPFDPDKHGCLLDMRDNCFAKGTELEDLVILLLS